MAFNVGQTVTANTTIRVTPADYGYAYNMAQGESGVITRVTSHKVLVRAHGRTGWVFKSQVTDPDPNAPKPRKLGEKPDAESIDILDPRINWIWEDVAKYATQQGYCSTFDTMASALGIPGRERNFKLTANVNGLRGSFSIKARTKREAEAKLAEKLSGATEVVSEEY